MILRVFLELIRILIVLLVIGGLMGELAKLIYMSFGINVDNTNGGWLVGLSILIFLFVLYRNKLQFSGYYEGKDKEKLPKSVSNFLILCSFVLLILAPIFH